MVKNTFFTAAILAILSANIAAVSAQTTEERFEQISERFIEVSPSFSPVTATWLGDHRYDASLDDVSTASRERQMQFLLSLDSQLARIDKGELPQQVKIDYEMLQLRIQSDIFELSELQEWAWDPTRYTGLAGDAVYTLMAREFAPLEHRLVNVAGRLEQFPRFLWQVRETLRPERVPPVYAETAVKQNRGVLQLIDELVVPNLEKLDPVERRRLERAIETATAAVEEHQTWLEETLLPNAKGDFRIGAELFDKKLYFSLGTTMTRRQLREMAETELQRTRLEMYETAKQIYLQEHPWTTFPDKPGEEYRQAIIRSALEIVCRELPPRDRLVETARESLETTTAFVREKNLLTLPPDPCEIIMMPEFRQGFSVAYCDSPGPLDTGQKTFYAISPIPALWTAEQVRSFLREYNLFSIHDLTIHEAMPGHFVQLAQAGRYPGKLRAMLASGTFIEGWAVYSERLMVEQGFLDNDPRMKLVQLKWYLRTITNTMIDQAIHVDNMQRDEAMRLMVELGLQEEREAALKWTRAQLSSTQLSTYFIGYREVAEIRTSVEAKEGSRFDLKRFHDRLLSFGSANPRFIRQLMLEDDALRSD